MPGLPPGSGRTTPVRPTSAMMSAASPRVGSEAAHTSVQVAVRIRPQTSSDLSTTVPARFQRVAVQAAPGSSTSLVVDSQAVATPTSSILASPPTPSRSSKQVFSFDRVFSHQSGQSEVFSVIEPLLDRFLEGYNVSVLAYGQTSSGKSYTMGTDHVEADELASDSDRLGIIPRAVSIVFDRLAKAQRESRGGLSYQAKNSYIELYNEDLIDLLAGDVSTAERPMVTIREDKTGNIIWSGLREVRVASAGDVMANLDIGSSLRQTNSTEMNAQSSRSHAIFSLVLTQRKWAGMGPPPGPTSPASPTQSRFGTARLSSVHSPGRMGSPAPGDRPSTPSGLPARPGSRIATRPTSSLGFPSVSAEDAGEWVTVVSKLNFVDLAGSERLKRTAAAGERVKEGIAINSGLHALGNVISALGDPTKARQTTHVPYRDSKLTRLLQDSLGGNAHTLMVACVSPTEMNVGETLNTLKYANRARNIKNRAELNETEVGWDDVEHLQALVTKLRGELAGGGRNGAINGLPGMAPIFEHSSIRELAPRKDILDLQQKYSDLAAKHAKLTAEMAKSRAEADHSKVAIDFTKAAEPIIEEYEKTLSVLESQLALNRAALATAEDSIREAEERIHHERASNESNVVVIDELRSRLNKLAEREATTEAHIRDLESRLKQSTDGDSQTDAIVTDLRKEIARHRETQLNSERYIKELEARLSAGSEATAALQAQVEALERDALRRDEAYRQLEQRLTTLDSSHDHKALLQELDDREQRLTVLARELDSARAGPMASQAASRSRSSDASTTADDDTQRHMHDLQLAHTKTQAELDAVSRKYKEALQEIEALARQITESRLSVPNGGLASPLPISPLPSSPGDPTSGTMAKAQNDGPPSRPSSRASQSSPVRTRRSSATPTSGKVSFFSRPPNSAAHGGPSHMRSASLSSEQGLLRSMPPGTPRSHSPAPTLRDRRNSLAGMHTERSYESLTIEVRQLQDVLADREREIKALEDSLSSKRKSTDEETTETLASPVELLNADIDTTVPLPSPMTMARTLQFELSSAGVDAEGETEQSAKINDLMRSMALKETAHKELVDSLQNNLATLRRQHDALEVLSRDQLRNTSNEIDRLRTDLQSRDQRVSSLENALIAVESQVAAKEAELVGLHDEHKRTVGKLMAELTERHTAEIKEQEDESRRVLRQVEAEHEAVVQRMSEDRDDREAFWENERKTALRNQSDAHERNLKQLSADHKQELSSLQSQMESSTSAHDVEVEELRKELAVQKSVNADSSTQADYEAALAEVKQSHTYTLKMLYESHEATLARLKEEAAESQAQSNTGHAEELALLRSEHEAAFTRTVEQHSRAMQHLREEREKMAAKSRAEAEQRWKELVGRHDADMAKLRSTHDRDLAEASKQGSAANQTLQEQHETALRAIAERHLSDLQHVEARHGAMLVTAKEEQDGALQAAQQTQQNALDQLNEHHDAIIVERDARQHAELESLKRAHAEALQTAADDHSIRFKALQSEHNDTIERLLSVERDLEQLRDVQQRSLGQELEQHQARAAEAQQALSEAVSRQQQLEKQLEQAASEHAAESRRLHDDLAIAVAELQRRNETGTPDAPAAELQEALDALVTLEKALLESQDERDQLLEELEGLRKRTSIVGTPESIAHDMQSHRDALNKAQTELAHLHGEHEKMKAERDRAESLLRELQGRINGADGYVERGPSMDSNGSNLEFVDAHPSPLPPASSAAWPASGVNIAVPVSAVPARVAHSSSPSAHPPPPTPPPNVPPPPLPVAQPSAPTTTRSSVTSTARSSSAQPDTALTSQRDSTASGSTDGATIDSRVQKKLEEQEATIAKLNKQLSHCETDLRANLDLVGTLENALNDSERNIRKSRLQMNDIAKERDTLQRENEELRNQVDQASKQAEDARNSYAASRRESEERTQAERRARDAAKEQLDRRIEEMRGKRSKFACF